jgi:hypothetical protein
MHIELVDWPRKARREKEPIGIGGSPGKHRRIAQQYPAALGSVKSVVLQNFPGMRSAANDDVDGC